MIDFLPIGSVIKIKGSDKKIMITSFNVIGDGKNNVFDYGGCVYPRGMLTSEDIVFFNNFQIAEVLFKGYECEEQKNNNILLNNERNK